MTGTLDCIESEDDYIPFACAALCEAGLRTRLKNEPQPIPYHMVVTKQIDAVEIIAAIENFYDVMFSQEDYDKLADLTKRGHITVQETTDWLKDCYKETR